MTLQRPPKSEPVLGDVYRQVIHGKIRHRHLIAATSVGLAMLGAAQSACGQEIPRPSVARQKAKSAAPAISNFRVGEVMMRVDSGLSIAYTSNVNLSPEAEPDFVISPSVGVNVAWAITKLNTLRFRTSFGYSYYLEHPELNRSNIVISPDSALTFDIYTGDFRINFHDQFSLQQDPTLQGSVSGVSQLGQFTNTAGVTVLWDTNDVIWTFGYDHYNLISTGVSSTSATTTNSNYNYVDHSTDQLAASASVRLASALIAGTEVTASYSNYTKQSASNYSTFSAGAFAEFQLTRYTHIYAGGGIKHFTARGSNEVASTVVTGTDLQPVSGNPTGFYATLSFIHRLNRYYSDNLSVGHSEDVDPYSGLTKTNFVRYNGTWRVNDKISLGIGAYYENVERADIGSISGTYEANYGRFGFTLSTGYQLTEHVGLGLGYQFVQKNSALATQDYTQNQVTISVGYRF